MPDLTKCANDGCLIREACWRHVAPASPLSQSWARFESDENGECEHFVLDPHRKTEAHNLCRKH